MGKCCHKHDFSRDYGKVTIDFDQKPVKNEDGTYAIELGSITEVDQKSVEEWKRLAKMHACSFACMAILSGLCLGLLIGHLIYLVRK